jgi:hypothetical protein
MKNNCELVIPGMGDLTLAVKNFPHPKESTEQVELSYGNGTVYVAGKTKVDGTMDVTYRELWDGKVVEKLRAWRSLVIDPVTKRAGKPSIYKFNGYVKRYNPDGTLREKEIIEGIWPTNLDIGEVDYEAGDPVEVTVSFSVDKTYAESVSSVLGAVVSVTGAGDLQSLTGVATQNIEDRVKSAALDQVSNLI